MKNPLSWINWLYQREPVWVATTVRLGLYVATYFGLDWSLDKMAAVVAGAEALFAFVTRQSVSSPTTVAAIRAGDDPAQRQRKGPPSDPPHVVLKQNLPKPIGDKPPPGAACASAVVRRTAPGPWDKPGAWSRLARGLSFALIAIVLTGCAGSLEEARSAGIAKRESGAAAAVTASPERCDALDSRRSWYSAAVKGFAFAAGGQGLASIATDDKELRIGLAVGTVVMGAGAALFGQLEGTTDERWAEECATR